MQDPQIIYPLRPYLRLSHPDPVRVIAIVGTAGILVSPMDWMLLILSTAIFGLAVFATGLSSLRLRRLPWRFNFWLILAGFAVQSTGLWLRGQEVGRCPLTTFSDVLWFLSWALACLYMLVGATYRVSLMGAFTAPVIFLLQCGALLAGRPPAVSGPRQAPDLWLELHAATSMVAYGAFGLACVASVMFLLQQWQLKHRTLSFLFFDLPSVSKLADVIRRLLVWGLAILSLGLLAAIGIHEWPDRLKLAVAVTVWCLYALLVVLMRVHALGPVRLAWLSVAAFVFSVLTLWGVTVVERGAL